MDSDGSNGWSITWNSTSVYEGSYALKAVATDNLVQTGSADIDITISNGNTPPTVSTVTVDSLVDSSSTVNKVTWKATVTATINPALAGAVVTGNWGGSAVICTTDTSGRCNFSTNVNTKVSSITFSVTNIRLAGYE